MSRPSISASSDAASSATAHLPDGSRSGPFDAPTDALRGPEPRGRHSRTSSNVSATSLGSGGALAAPRGQHGRKTSGGTKWTSFGQAVKSLSSRSQHTNLASLLDERERVTVEQLAAQPVSEPGPVQKSADLSLRSRTPSPDRVLRKDIERARVEPPETLRSDPVLGSKRRLDAEGVPDQPPGAPAGAQIPNWAASGTNLIESVSWDGDPRPAPLMVPPWQLPNEASQTSMLVSPDSLFNVTPATSASTSPSQTRNVTPMNSLGMGRALGSIPESPAVASAPFSLPMPSQSAPTAFHPFSGGLPPPSASEASPLTGGGSLSSSPRSQPRSGFPGLAPVKSRLDAIDVSDPFFLKLASETAKVSRTPAVPAAASGQKPARTSLEPEDALAPSASSSVPALPIPSVSPLSQQSPLSLSESSPRSPNISSETLKRSLAYRNYMEKRYGLLNEVVTSAAEAEGLPEGALPQNNPWNLADAIRFREQKQAGRGGKVKPDSRTK